jgi:hypothetical protein
MQPQRVKNCRERQRAMSHVAPKRTEIRRGRSDARQPFGQLGKSWRSSRRSGGDALIMPQHAAERFAANDSFVGHERIVDLRPSAAKRPVVEALMRA